MQIKKKFSLNRA